MGMASLNNAVLSAKHLNNDHGTPHAPKLRNRPHNKEMGQNEKLRRSLGMVLSVYNIHSCFGILLSCFAFTSFACLGSLASLFSSASNPTPPLELNVLICDKTGSREPQVMQFTLDWTRLSPHSRSTWLPGPETLRQQLGWGSSRAESFRSQGGKNCWCQEIFLCCVNWPLSPWESTFLLGRFALRGYVSFRKGNPRNGLRVCLGDTWLGLLGIYRIHSQRPSIHIGQNSRLKPNISHTNVTPRKINTEKT